MDHSKIRLLHVEDDVVDRMAFERYVKEKKLPYEHKWAQSVDQGTSALETEIFDAVLLDYILADGTAFDLLLSEIYKKERRFKMTNLILKPNRTFKTFDNWFDNLFNYPACEVESESAFIPRVDIKEEKDSVSITFELPGLDKSDIKVLVKDNVLSVSGERKFEKEEKENGYLRSEIRSGSFSRSFTLPDYVDEEKIQADYKNGMLVIRMPKVEEVKPKEIDVKVS